MNKPTVGEFSDFLESQGNSTKPGWHSSGRPVLVVKNSRGIFTVTFSDCATAGDPADRRCGLVRFNAWYSDRKTTLSRANDDNRKFRMIRFSVERDGGPGISMSLNIDGTFKTGNLRNSLEAWTDAMDYISFSYRRI